MKSVRKLSATILLGCAIMAAPANAQEAFAGLYVHEVETPLTFDVDESGADIELGYRWAGQDALGFIGKPQPYVFGSLNTAGDTSFAGTGLSWKLGKGPVFVRPGVGLVVHDGPETRVDPQTGKRTDLGSRVLFAPEIGIGTQLSGRVDIEASWVHISHAQLFDSEQNPGIDMMGVRLTMRLD